MAMEVMEDDVLFADLSKQIALLIMDDDELKEEFPAQSPPVHAQGFHHLPEAILMPPVPYTLYDMGYRRDQSKGTGVFIPRSSIPTPRRKNRSGKSTSSNNSNNNFQRHNSNEKSGVPAASQVANSSTSRLHSNCCTNSGALKNRA